VLQASDASRTAGENHQSRHVSIDDVYGTIHLVQTHIVFTAAPGTARPWPADRAANADTISWSSTSGAHSSPAGGQLTINSFLKSAGTPGEQGSINLRRSGTRLIPNDDWTLVIGPAIKSNLQNLDAHARPCLEGVR
jgi:hypothetical protein